MTRSRGRRGAASAAAVVLGAVLLLGGCASTSPVVETGELDGQAVQAVLPPQGTRVRALVVYLHGLRESAAATTEDSDVARVVDALARHGYAVVSSDADGDSFGSPAAQADYAELAAQGAARYGTSATFLLAESMGGLSAVPLAADGSVPDLLGTLGISPALSLEAASGQDVYASEITAAWGRAVTSADDPLAAAPQELAGQRFRFYVTPGDTAVPTAEHADAFAARYGKVADVELVACTGEHVDATCFQPDDVMAWFDQLLAERS